MKVCETGNDVESWPATSVRNFDPKEFKVSEILGGARPIAWNQGGYDAVLLTSVGDGMVAVRVVQVTAGTTNSLKLNYVESLLGALREAGLQTRERGRRVCRAARQRFPSGLHQWPLQDTAGSRVAIW